MALTPSSMPELGAPAPLFTLHDTVSGQSLSLHQLKAPKATVLMFLSNHCPHVKHVLEGVVRLAYDYRTKGVGFIAISSGDADTYPEDSPERMRVLAERLGFPFPYLYDETQEVARACQAACTPDFFVYDAQLHLAYRGQIDDARPDNSLPVSGRDLRVALNALLSGTPLRAEQKPGEGSPIRWREEWLYQPYEAPPPELLRTLI